MDLLSDIIVEPKLAPLGHRVGAALIDLTILWLISFVVGYFFGESYADDGAVGFDISGAPALALFLIYIGLMPIQEGLTGRTIGKRIVKIRVVKGDFSESSVSASIVRHLFDVVDWFLFFGLLVAAVSKRKQRIGDLVAKTVVVCNQVG